MLAGCDQKANTHRATLKDVATAQTADANRPKPMEPQEIASGEVPKPKLEQVPPGASTVPEAKVEEILEGDFRGKGLRSRVLFLDNFHIIHAWDENGAERREPVTTTYPPGHRECKALRSVQSQDFLLCMYWITGPGGGRIDGVLFDLKRRILGEFFSAAMNMQLLSTLCFPKSMVGPMPSFELVEWSTRAATPENSAEVLVKVDRKGWSTWQAESLVAKSSKPVRQFQGSSQTGRLRSSDSRESRRSPRRQETDLLAHEGTRAVRRLASE